MKAVILGIGNPLKGDDGVGPYIIEQLKAYSLKLKAELINAETVPENYIQKLVDSKPDELVIIDAINFGGKPGEVKYFKEVDSENISISTHNLPPELFINFIKSQTNAEITIIGIQPKSLQFDAPLSEEVNDAAKKLMGELCTKYTR